MDADTHDIPPGKQKRKSFSLGIRWLGGRGLHTAHHQEYYSDILRDCVGCLGMISIRNLMACMLNLSCVLWHVDQ